MTDLWVYLAASPLLWLFATLFAGTLGMFIFERTGRRQIANPTLIAVIMLITLLLVTKTPYETYFEGAQFVHFLLGPATVALAVPLFHNRRIIRRAALPTLAALLAGSVVAIVSGVVIAQLLGATDEVTMSLAPRSTTTPVAMAIAEQIGGIPSLAAALVSATGIPGSMLIFPLLARFGLVDDRARGLAIGVTSHGMGTARAFQDSQLAGSFAAIGLGLNALATAALVPLIIPLLK
jgi:predicted murein hydrolase (TIGR00659 family)